MPREPKKVYRSGEGGLFRFRDSGKGGQSWLDNLFRVRDASSMYAMWSPPRKFRIWRKK